MPDNPSSDQPSESPNDRPAEAPSTPHPGMPAPLRAWRWLWVAGGLLLFAFFARHYWEFHLKEVNARIEYGEDEAYALRTVLKGPGDGGGPLSCNDFKHIYLGAQLLWRGQNPYDLGALQIAAAPLVRSGLISSGPLPYVYPAFTGWTLRFLAEMPFDEAAVRWFYDNHLMVLLAALATAWGFRRAGAGMVLLGFFGVAAFYLPLWRNNSAGQLNAPLLLAYALIWIAIQQKQRAAAGVLAGAAAWFKLSPGILLFYFLLTRRWREAAWMCAAGAAIGLATWLWTGADVQMAFLRTVANMGYGRSTGAEFNHHFYADPYNQSFNSFFHHVLSSPPGVSTTPWFDLGPHSALFANAATWLVSIGLLAAVVSIARRQRPRFLALGDEYESLRYSLFIFLSLFLPSLCWDHYFTQLLFPMAAVLAALRRRMAVATAVLFAGAVYALAIFIDFGRAEFLAGAGLMGMSAKLWAALLLFAATARLAYRARRDSGAPPRVSVW